MLGPLNLDLAVFGVSTRNGFLPDYPPLKSLSSSYYESWEVLLSQLPSLIKTASTRCSVDQLAVLSTAHLISESEWQRAYLILSFFTHAYIWEAGGPSQRLPPAISVPFLDVAAHLGLPPTATYAALNLWNFESISGENDFTKLEDLRSLHTFTGTRDEEWFYLISVAIEAYGAKIIPAVMKAMDAVRANDSSGVAAALVSFSQNIRAIGNILERMDEHCSPKVFYDDIRPFLAGSKNMELAGLPRGVFYDEGEGKGEWRQYSGGSNAQSSLIQFFDIVLGVEHTLTQGSKARNSFLQDMRNYMPGSHRAFLKKMESVVNIRKYAESTSIAEVTEAYNLAVKELELFRGVHIQVVSRFIIIPSRQKSPNTHPGLNLAVASSNTELKELHGTGGTQLLPFLRQSRDETKEATLTIA
ncbi:putative indoleamine 2,3-dioxygenase pyrrole 2,3-dioxygenase [Diplocarpon rosae]|nr:putative indoleamine 2,3-dioxygenase pyrrole 2,3-dioxygenase [Diplocarpon rosae]